MIRFVSGSDAESLLKIYAQYIDTPVTFDYSLPTVTQFQNNINRIVSEYPYLVYEEEGIILGYAYAHRHMEKAAYQWNAETTIYLDRDACSRGIGTRLYSVLLDLLKLQGVRNVYGCVTHPNERSERLHEALGFQKTGTYHQAGYKCGRWYDVVWYELSLTDHQDGEEPLEPCSIHDVAPALLRMAMD